MWCHNFQSTQLACLSLTSLVLGFLPTAAFAGPPCCGGEVAEPALLPFYQAEEHAKFPQFRPEMQLAQGPRPLTASPPAGTLGRTYELPSREIPADKHPRVAMIDVHVRKATSVRVLNVNVHREEDDIEGFVVDGNNSLWRFETKPLVPGIPYIYKVIFRFSEEPNAKETVRYVRMIPGRIVELVFEGETELASQGR